MVSRRVKIYISLKLFNADCDILINKWFFCDVTNLMLKTFDSFIDWVIFHLISDYLNDELPQTFFICEQIEKVLKFNRCCSFHDFNSFFSAFKLIIKCADLQKNFDSRIFKVFKFFACEVKKDFSCTFTDKNKVWHRK